MKRRQPGLTLIELMVALAMAIILLAIGIPSFQAIEANNRAAANANGFVTALSLARMEAVSRGVPVALCPTTDGSSCGDETNWARGLLVFADPTSDAAPSAADVLKSFGAPRGNPTATAIPSSMLLVRFNSRGERSSDPDEQRVKFQLGAAGPQVRCVCVSLAGHTSTERSACTTDDNRCP